MSDGKKVILFVDDDEDNGIFAEKIFTHYGYDPKIVRTGAAAIEYCQKNHPDLILMDISLPDIDGLEVTKQIKQIAGFDQIPIIAITGYDMKEEVLKAGCTSYFRKPFDPNELLTEIQKHLN